MLIQYSLIFAVCALGLGCVATGQFGLALMVGVPFSLAMLVGAVLGFRLAMKWLVGLTLFAGFASSVVMLNLGGIFCALMALGLGSIPIIPGVWLGHELRRHHKQRAATMLALLSPFLLHVVDLATRGPKPMETVATSQTIPLDPAAAWDAMRFYEDVDGPRPLALRLGLPRPIRTVGAARRVGAKTQCIYEGGYLLKRTTEVVPQRYLAFEVLEQVGVENRSIELVDGVFELQPVGEGQTRVTMTTRYVPLLAPRWYWRPLEAWVVHSLHEHIANSMARQPASRPVEPALDQGMDLARRPGMQQQVEVAVLHREAVRPGDPDRREPGPLQLERRGIAHPRRGDAIGRRGDDQHSQVPALAQRVDRGGSWN